MIETICEGEKYRHKVNRIPLCRSVETPFLKFRFRPSSSLTFFSILPLRYLSVLACDGAGRLGTFGLAAAPG